MTDKAYKNCPYCDEKIKAIAIKCRYCKSMLYEKDSSDADRLKVEPTLNVSENKTEELSTYSRPHSAQGKKIGAIIAMALGSLLLLACVVIIFGKLSANNGLFASESNSGIINDALLEGVIIDKSVIEYFNQDELMPECFIVNVDILRLRIGPSTNVDIIDRLEKGANLLLLNKVSVSQDEEWLNVITKSGKIGWVHGDYVVSQPDLSVAEEIRKARKEIFSVMIDKDFYKDPVLLYLGWTKDEIIAKHGLPDSVYEVGGAGGYAFLYKDIDVAFIFAGDEGVVNNFELYPGASFLVVTIGTMTFDDIERILGKHSYRGAIEEGADLYISTYWLGDRYQSTAEIEVYFYSDGDNFPADYARVLWKKYWW